MPPTVMVVDDDADVLEITRLVLEGGGYRVFVAHSGQEALQSLEPSRPDLILLDINMPDMDGWQVLRMLKADDRTASIPVAMFSIKMDVRNRFHGLQEGALAYITKPFSPEDLLKSVRRVFESLERRVPA